ncbi:MAG: AtpZ/AtpI family protein [Peptococcaceae bacterium]|nr:AtpZ/AtpI family protein [Peptococcaceae bacterium]
MPGKRDTDKKKKNQGRGGALQALALTTTIGTELAITVVLGYYGGQYLDRQFATAPWLMLAGVLVGLAAGIAGVYKTLQGFFRERE